MKFYVHFSTIQCRFSNLKNTIDAWTKEKLIENIIITTSITDKRFTTIEPLKQYKSSKLILQTLDVDYGPSNKILGALKFYESIENKDNVYIIICDDDNIYKTKNLIQSYIDSLNIDDNYIYTHFVNNENRIDNMCHLQGADTYLLSPKFLNYTTYLNYETYLKNIILECPESFFQDDYIICYYIYYICNLKIKTVTKPISYGRFMNDKKFEQMHLNSKIWDREYKTIEFFKNKIKN